MSHSNKIHWSTPEDSKKDFLSVEAKVRNAWTVNANVAYLNDPASLATRDALHPPPEAGFVELGPTAFQLLPAAARGTYSQAAGPWLKKKKAHDDWNTKKEDDAGKAIEILRALFTEECVFSQQIDAHMIAHATNLLRFAAVMTSFRVFYPNRASDRERFLATMKTLRDNDGRGFAQYKADFLVNYNKLANLGYAPDASIIREYLKDGVTNEKLENNLTIYLRSDEDNIPLPAGAATHWQFFLDVSEKDINLNPKNDIRTASTVKTYAAHSNTRDRSIPRERANITPSKNYVQFDPLNCDRCGRDNHPTDKCFARYCGNCQENIQDQDHDSNRCTKRDDHRRDNYRSTDRRSYYSAKRPDNTPRQRSRSNDRPRDRSRDRSRDRTPRPRSSSRDRNSRGRSNSRDRKANLATASSSSNPRSRSQSPSSKFASEFVAGYGAFTKEQKSRINAKLNAMDRN